MKIIILFLAIIACTFVNTSEMTTGVCLNLEVKVTSSLQSKAQSFDVNMKKLFSTKFGLNSDSFAGTTLIPIEQVGFVMEKTANSQSLDAIHHKYLRNESSTVWFPYAYTGNWSRQGYVVVSQTTRTSASKKETPLVSFEFVYDPSIKNINNSDMNKIQSALQSNTQLRITIKRQLKQYILQHQDIVLNASELINKNINSNTQITTEIATLTKKLQTIVQEITTTTTKETTLTQEVALKTTTLAKTEDQIADLHLQIAALEKRLKAAEAELANYKPSDLSNMKAQLTVQVSMMGFPQNAPDEFKKEFTISDNYNKNAVDTAYTNCNKNAANVMNCFNASSAAPQRKKLRRGFF